jgi:hypothetical protein
MWEAVEFFSILGGQLMSDTLLLLTQSSLTRLTRAIVVLGLMCTASFAATVESEDYESYPLGTFGTVSEFSDASYGGANGVASIVTGQALQFAFDVKTGVGSLNTNVSALFPAPAMNNPSPNLANYRLDFDLSVPSGITTGWFGVLEMVTPGSGPNGTGLPLGAITVGGPAVHKSVTMDTLTRPFGGPLDPTNTTAWRLNLVALGFPANGGGGVVRTTLLLDNVKVTSIPEPSTLVLLGIASTGGLCFVRKLRQSRG